MADEPKMTTLPAIPGLRTAALEDAPAVLELVNEAFQPEIHFRPGPRTNLDAIRKHFPSGKFFVIEKDGEMIACVYVEFRGDVGYIGMLSVRPSVQRMGLGRKLMAFAEQQLKNQGCRRTELLIVNANAHLLKLYSKMGYVETGTAPYPPEIATHFPVHFIRMEKEL